MSSRKKGEAVLRLLRGEELDLVSRDLDITAATLSAWRGHFVAGGQARLTSWAADGCDTELARLNTLVGDPRCASNCLEKRSVVCGVASLWLPGGPCEEPRHSEKPTNAREHATPSIALGRAIAERRASEIGANTAIVVQWK